MRIGTTKNSTVNQQSISVSNNYNNLVPNKAVILIFITITFLIVLLAAVPTNVFAGEPERNRSGVSITVVVPSQEPGPAEPTNYAYPTHVWESRKNNRREIIRVYELRENECSTQIRRSSFEREGFRFDLAEIVRREIPSHSIRDHTEVVTINTQANDLNTILSLLPTTIDFISEEGYVGVLILDISSVKVESQGTRSSSHAVTRTREFPHLTSTDTSLIPRTITENGITYYLANVEWQTQNTQTIDFTEIATTFTAVATFSGTATRTATIGYTTTAAYHGKITRVSTGRTEFTAQFIGTPIIEAAVPEPEALPEQIIPEAMSNVVETVTVEQVHIGGLVIEIDRDVVTNIAAAEEVKINYTPDGGRDDFMDYEYNLPEETRITNLVFSKISFALLFVVGVVIAFFAGKKGWSVLKTAKKAACLVLALCITVGISQAVYAAPQMDNDLYGSISVGALTNPTSALCYCDCSPAIVKGRLCYIAGGEICLQCLTGRLINFVESHQRITALIESMTTGNPNHFFVHVGINEQSSVLSSLMFNAGLLGGRTNNTVQRLCILCTRRIIVAGEELTKTKIHCHS